MRVALVYDRINKWGGAERVLLALHDIWPDAPLYTSVYDEKKASWAKVFPSVIPSFLQKFPFAKNHHEIYPWLTPLAFESFNFDNYDLVISVTSSESKDIITKPNTFHICYCLTPTRFLWSGYDEYLNNPGFGFLNQLVKMVLPFIFKRLKDLDLVACHRPDYYIAISQTVKNRIKKYYQQESIVVYPPVDTDFFKVKEQKLIANEYFLIVSRLVPYKKVDLAIEVFNQLGWKLKIVGSGSEKKSLKQMARDNIELVGELTELELLSYYQECTGLLVCQEEDFGLVSLEAQACGKPVLAFNKGGAAETVINGKTGLLFEKQSVTSLREALEKFKTREFSSKVCRENALKYNRDNFKKNFLREINKLWEHKNLKITT